MSINKSMSKKTTEEQAQQPKYIEELLKNSNTVLSAKTRDELAEIVNNLPANLKYSVGAVGKNYETGAFTLRVDIID